MKRGLDIPPNPEHLKRFDELFEQWNRAEAKAAIPPESEQEGGLFLASVLLTASILIGTTIGWWLVAH